MSGDSNIDTWLANLEARLPSIVRGAVEKGIREVIEDRQAQQRNRTRFVSIALASEIFAISSRKLQGFIREGKLAAYSPGHDGKVQRADGTEQWGKLLVDVGELDAFVRQYRITTEVMDLEKIADEAIRTMSPSVERPKAASGTATDTTQARRSRRRC